MKCRKLAFVVEMVVKGEDFFGREKGHDDLVMVVRRRRTRQGRPISSN
jgi:hypothetical protein